MKLLSTILRLSTPSATRLTEPDLAKIAFKQIGKTKLKRLLDNIIGFRWIFMVDKRSN